MNVDLAHRRRETLPKSGRRPAAKHIASHLLPGHDGEIQHVQVAVNTCSGQGRSQCLPWLCISDQRNCVDQHHPAHALLAEHSSAQKSRDLGKAWRGSADCSDETLYNFLLSTLNAQSVHVLSREVTTRPGVHWGEMGGALECSACTREWWWFYTLYYSLHSNTKSRADKRIRALPRPEPCPACT